MCVPSLPIPKKEEKNEVKEVKKIIKKKLNLFMKPEVITAFNRLKELFTIILILVIFDLEREIIIEINVLRFVIVAVLS